MCPLCLGTATLLVSGGTSAGGLALALLRGHFPDPHTKASQPIPLAAPQETTARTIGHFLCRLSCQARRVSASFCGSRPARSFAWRSAGSD